MTRQGTPEGVPDATAFNDHGKGTTGPRREVADRLHAAAVVTNAMDAGDWAADVEILDQLASLIGSASRWALVAELEDGAA